MAPTGGIVLLFLLTLFVNAFFLWLGAQLVVIPGASYGRCLLVAGTGCILLALTYWLLPGLAMGSLAGALVGALVMALVGQRLFVTTFAKALLAVIFAVIITFGARLLFGLLFHGSWMGWHHGGGMGWRHSGWMGS